PLLEGVLITPINAAGEGTALQAPPAGDPGAHWQRLPGQAGWRLGEHWLLPASEPLPAAVAELPQLTLQDQERWRLQQGLPALPGEINDDTNPFELGLAARVSLSKGCYVGQETLAKLATYDGVKQQLRRWCCPAGAALPPEASLYRADGSRAGSISSRLALPEGGWIGLALVRRPALDDDELRLGDDASGPWLRLSVPPAFAPPPVGAGGGQAQPAGGS
ncbi:MAG: folate-binding protein, partial [Cyanobacteriota bacterium]